MRGRGWLLLASLLVATPAWADKVGLGVGAGAAPVKDDLLELIGEHGTAVETPKAPAKGGKRKAWAKDAQASLGLSAVVVAEVAGKRLKLGLWIDGKPVSATGANLKGKGLDAGARAALKSWFKAQLAGGAGGRVASAPAGGGDDDDAGGGDDEEAPVVAPPAAPAKAGKTGAVAKSEPRGGPVVAPPPPPPSDDEEPTPPRERAASGGGGGGGGASSPGRAERSGAGDRDIAGTAPARNGDVGGGMLGSALGIAPGLPPLVVLHAEFHSVGRGFSYNDPITSNLRPYSVAFMPAPGVAVEAYPLTVTGVRALSGFGLTFGFRTSLGVKSARANSTVEFPTTYSALEVGALYRIMLGDGYQSAALIPAIGWSSTSFALDPVGTEREDQLPNVSYPGLKMGLGFDVPLFAAVRLFGDGAMVIVGTPGEIISPTYFKAGSVNGIVGKLGFSIGVLDHVAAELGLTYQHFFYAFEPEVGDAFVAGGALDQFVVGRAGVRVEL